MSLENPPRTAVVGNIRVAVFEDLGAEFLERALSWFEHGPSSDALVLKSGRVWRCGPHGVKFFPRRPPRHPLRSLPARRCADRHFSLAPVRTPRPVLVLENDSKESLLVYEFVEGEFLDTIWAAGGPGVDAFPHFFAQMHRHRVFHGDFHLRNFIWNGREWVLLDLDGVRPPLHALRAKALAFDQWGRVHFGLQGAAGLRTSFEKYLAAAGHRWNPEWAWARVVVTSARLARRRGLDASYALSGGPNGEPISLTRQVVLGLVSWLS